jgi:iron complex transport system ATP-binding protein
MRRDAERHAPLLEFEQLTVYRDATKVLDRFSLAIPAGQNVAILGPNGSGKSTLIKLVTRELYPVVTPDASLRVLGRDRWVLSELREHIGIVSNDLMTTCTRDITGRELVLSAFFGSVGLWPHHVVTPELEAKGRLALGLMEVEHLADRHVNQLSSGEARRLLVARALAHGPQALVLDEPTNSLDLRACHDFTTCLCRLAAQGTSLILVTHHLPDIVPEIDRVVVLADGKVLRDGRKADVLTNDVLTESFGVSIEVEERDGFYQAWSAGQRRRQRQS